MDYRGAMAGRRHDAGGHPSEYHCAFDAEQRLVQYVYAIGTYHYNWHPAIEVSVLLTGEVEFCADGATRRLRPGDLCLVNSNVGHATLAIQPDSTMVLLHVEPSFLSAALGSGRIGPWDVDLASRETTARLRLLLARMMLTGVDSVEARAAYLRDLFDLVATLSTSCRMPEGTGETPLGDAPNEALSRTIDHVERHFRDRVTLAQLGQAAGYNPTYLSQLFSSRLGMSPSAYLTRVRLREATRDLGDPRRRVADVAVANGFPDVKAFNLAFRRTFGKSPTEYRKLLTVETAAVDPYFRKRFVPRHDAVVSSVLEGFAATADPAPRPDEDLRDELASMEQAAQNLASRLASTTARWS